MNESEMWHRRAGPYGREGIHPQIEVEIADLTLQGLSTREIERALAPLAEELRVKPPSLRTIQRIARQTKPADTTGGWQIEDSTPEDARAILDFLAEEIFRQGPESVIEGIGRVRVLRAGFQKTDWTRRIGHTEAAWVARIRRLFPDHELSNMTIELLAFRYTSDRAQGRSTAALDGLLAFAPWRGGKAAEDYERATSMGLVPRAEPRLINLIRRYQQEGGGKSDGAEE